MSAVTVVDEDLNDVDAQDLISDVDSIRSEPSPHMISPEARAIAERHAAEDRALLAKLVKEGRVVRDPAMAARVSGAAAFRREVEAIVKPPVNLAIRPRRKRR